MARKTACKKSAKGRIRRGEQVTPERLMELSFAYVQMLLNTEKGDTFSFNEIRNWLKEAGFKKVRKVEAPGPSPLILATRPW